MVRISLVCFIFVVFSGEFGRSGCVKVKMRSVRVVYCRVSRSIFFRCFLCRDW